MTFEDNLRIVNELGQQKEQKLYVWLRYLIGLASGALTFLLALGKGIPEGVAGTWERIAVTSLGLGILLGSLRLFVEVWISRAQVNNLIAQAKRQIDTLTPAPFSTSGVDVPPALLACEYLCYLALIAAMVALIVVAWTSPVSRPLISVGS